jgi:hypothetical protein
MEGSAAARGEDISREKSETVPLEESATALSPPMRTAISAEWRKDYEERGNSLTIRQAMSAATIMTTWTAKLEPSLEEKVAMIRVTMSAKAESRQQLGGSRPTTQVELPSSGESALSEGNGNGVPAAQPKISLFPFKKKKRAIKPLVLDDPNAQKESLGPNAQPEGIIRPDGPNAQKESSDNYGPNYESAAINYPTLSLGR